MAGRCGLHKLPWEQDGTQETAVAHLMTAASGQRGLLVDSFGDPSGMPVFLMHHTPGCHTDPRPRAIVLYQLGIHLITYSRPGYSGSSRHIGRTIADAALDVQDIADHLGIDQFGVVGISGGAPHALACAALLGDRVICAAALCSLAPRDAVDLDWFAGMADFNAGMFLYAENSPSFLEAELEKYVTQIRSNPEDVFMLPWPELFARDAELNSNVELRRIVSQIYTGALRETTYGWIDDLLALSKPWCFDVSAIKVPVELWSGSHDAFSPTAHTVWLAERLETSQLEVEPEKSHFSAVDKLPNILRWIVSYADMCPQDEVPVGRTLPQP
jgi:pimeloyl-ACP methyl ester carboxylesterase